MTGDAGTVGQQFAPGGLVEAFDKMENGIARLGREMEVQAVGGGVVAELPRLKLCVKTKLPRASLLGKSVAKRGNGARIISVGRIGFS